MPSIYWAPGNSRHQLRRKDGYLALIDSRKHIIDLIIRIRHLNTNLRQVIRMTPAQDLFIMVQILGHRDQMILDVREIESNVRFRGDAPVLVASFR